MKLYATLLFVIAFFFVQPLSATTFIVTSNADNGTGTLREALANAAANGSATADLIHFNLPDNSTAGRTIAILSLLPNVTSNLEIDGTTQPSNSFGISDAKVIIQPAQANSILKLSYCLKLDNVSNIKIFGLFIKDFCEFSLFSNLNEPTAVPLKDVTDFTFGKPGKGNIIAGCSYGIFKAYFAGIANNITIQSNFFGVDADGSTILSNYTWTNIIGIELTQASNIKIGGTNLTEGNLLSGLNAAGIVLIEVTNNIEIGYNKFHTNYTETDMVYSGSSYEAIGSRDSPADFDIHHNTILSSIYMQNNTGHTKITNNFFGLNRYQNVVNGPFQLGGVADFNDCQGTIMIGGHDESKKNIFAYQGYGVINQNSKVTILKNSFFCHADPAIALVGYNFPNKPFININNITNNSIQGKAKPNSLIELFNDDSCQNCEGKIFIGRTSADANGFWTYTGTFGGAIVATATNADDSVTSQFSAASINIGNVVIKNATCGKNNGSINNIIIESGTQWHWEDINGNIVGTDTNLINVGPGQYKLVVHIGNNGCSTSSQFFLVNNVAAPAADPNAFLITQPVCGQPNGGISYTGFLTSTISKIWVDSVGNAAGSGSTIINLWPGKYYFRVALQEDTLCYTQYGPFVLRNQTGPSVNITNSIITNVICSQSNGSIHNISIDNASGNQSIKWIDTLGNTVGIQLDLINVAPGKYRLKYKDDSNCDTITTNYFTIRDLGVIIIDSIAKVITPASCSLNNGSVKNIIVTGADNFKWYNIITNTIVSNTLDLVNVPPGNYQLKLNNSVYGCVNQTGVFEVRLSPPPKIDESAVVVADDICSLQKGSVKNIQLINASLPVDYKWYDNTGNITGISNDLLNIGMGNYYMSVTDVYGCKASSKVYTVNDNVHLLSTPQYDNTVIPSGTATVLAVKNLQPGIYNLYDDITAILPLQVNTSGDFTTSVLSSNKQYYVQLTEGSCKSEKVKVTVEVVMKSKIFIPNAFTPNNDLINDRFKINIQGLIHLNYFRIYNRYGELILDTKNAGFAWDGNYKGFAQPMGSYFWILNAKDIDGAPIQLKGMVTLIR